MIKREYLSNLADAEKPRFLIDGDNDFLHNEWIQNIAAKYEVPLKGGVVHIDVNKTSSLNVFQQMMEIDMLIPERVVVLDGLDTIVEKTKFYHYFEESPGIVVATFTIPVHSPNVSFLKRLREEAYVLDGNDKNSTELLEWTRKKSEAFGLSLQPNQIVMLTDLVGNDLWAIYMALEKMRLLSKSTELSNVLIRQALAHRSKDSAREIAENILYGRPAATLQALDKYKAGRSAHNFMLYVEELLFRVLTIRSYAERQESTVLVREELELKSDKQYQWLQEIPASTSKLYTMYIALLPFLREDYYSGWERVEQFIYESFM